MNPFGNHIGIDVIVNDRITEFYEKVQFRFPKSKKRRIRKKWKKRPENFRMEKRNRVLKLGRQMFVHSLMFEQIKNEYKTI